MKIIPTSIQNGMDRVIAGVGKKIPAPVKNWVSSPRTAEFVENTFFAVSVETAMKAIGRPIFIMADKEADSEEKKKYAATKELLYQGLCLTLYLGVMPKFKEGMYNIISKGLSRKNPNNKVDIDAFNEISKLIKDKYKTRKSTAKTITDKIKRKEFEKQALDEILKIKNSMYGNKKFYLGKGTKEFGTIICSIVMLTIIAPQISHFVIHSIMKVLGFDKEHNKEDKVQTPKFDVKK